MSFKLNLNVLMECLGIFGSGSLTGQSQSPSLILHYDGYGEPLVLIMEEGKSQLIIFTEIPEMLMYMYLNLFYFEHIICID